MLTSLAGESSTAALLTVAATYAKSLLRHEERRHRGPYLSTAARAERWLAGVRERPSQGQGKQAVLRPSW